MDSNVATGVAAGPAEDGILSSAYAKAAWRILPLLLIVYGLGYIDRLNVSFAQLSMKEKLGFSDAIYGLGAGIFFISYFIFEIPSNLVLSRFGARKTISWIMALWGMASMATALITTAGQFYAIRFLLGIFEAGVWPGIVLYLGYWFPASRKGATLALLLTSGLVASMISGPLSGWILQSWDGVQGLANWQWLFILEGIPSVIFAFVTFFMLTDRPSEATWLTAAEQSAMTKKLADDEVVKAANAASGKSIFVDPMAYILGFGIFGVLCGYYAVTFWTPTIIKAAGVTNMFHVGLYAVIPNVVAMAAMVLNARHSDKTQERGWHFAIPLTLSAVGLALSAMQPDSLAFSILALSLALAGVMGAFPTFWAIATAYLPAPVAAVGVALINTVGATGGFVSPYVVGSIKTATGSLLYSFIPILAVMVLASITTLTLVPKGVLRRSA